jgi:hypothetical protein
VDEAAEDPDAKGPWRCRCRTDQGDSDSQFGADSDDEAAMPVGRGAAAGESTSRCVLSPSERHMR